MDSSAENYDANATIDDGSCYVTTTTTTQAITSTEKAEEMNDDSGTGKVLTLGAIGAGVFALIRKKKKK